MKIYHLEEISNVATEEELDSLGQNCTEKHSQAAAGAAMLLAIILGITEIGRIE